MKIRIIENEIRSRNVYKEGNIEHIENEHIPTGRSWDLEIPIEHVELKEVWLGIKGDIRELIRLAKSGLR